MNIISISQKKNESEKENYIVYLIPLIINFQYEILYKQSYSNNVFIINSLLLIIGKNIFCINILIMNELRELKYILNKYIYF